MEAIGLLKTLGLTNGVKKDISEFLLTETHADYVTLLLHPMHDLYFHYDYAQHIFVYY